jgi:hypothetical protein
MRMRLAPLVLAAGLAGCGPKTSSKLPDAPDNTATTDDGPTCERVGANVATVLGGELRDAQAEEAMDAVSASCRDDHWSTEARTCVASATDHETLQGCRDKLDPAVRDKIDAKMQAILDEGHDDADDM